ncbi:hypothetical protein PPSIR1_03258 [Plesiocystis pacifica SIR-1]|uniref:Uncharacterized protein n=1 Tax=Plesiocystis pacifica SIR-1 TaxID=391625 RepID=A6GJY1_9BACT|nr:hypothetical protein PPSIR1_03258 [Plesiocystis pacifica SIR-1]
MRWRRFRLGGIASCSRASTVLITPATPAAATRWPMLVLTAPSQSGPRSGRSAGRLVRSLGSLNTASRESVSMGSPSTVPVPWHSM